MANYFFHLSDGFRLSRDGTGCDYKDVDEARLHGVRLLAERVAQAPEQFLHDGYWQVEVARDDGLTFTSLQLSETKAPLVSYLPSAASTRSES